LSFLDICSAHYFVLSAFGRSFFKGLTLSQSTPAPINVLAVSLATRQAPVMLTGTLTTNALHVISLTPLPRSIVQIRERMEAMAARTATGMIEDPTGLMTGMGYRVRLDDMTADDRPVLALAMERYRALTAMGGLYYPGDNPSQFQISDAIMNIKMGDNGKAVYEIDWAQLRDASRVLLLLIYGAMCQGPMHATYLERLFSGLSVDGDESVRLTSFRALTIDYDREQALSTPQVAGLREGWL